MDDDLSIDCKPLKVQLSHGSTISGERGAHGGPRAFCAFGSLRVDRLYCFSLRVDIFPRAVRVSRSELTKKRVVGVERVGERGKRNGIDGFPFQSFRMFLPTEISKKKEKEKEMQGGLPERAQFLVCA